MPAFAAARCTSGPCAANRARSAADRYASIGSTGSMMCVSASKMRMPSRAIADSSVAAGDAAGLAGESDDVQAGVGAIGQIDEAPLVGLDIVRLDRDLAAPRAVRHAPLRRPFGGRRDVEGGLARRIRIAHVDGAHAAVEIGDEDELAIEDRR